MIVLPLFVLLVAKATNGQVVSENVVVENDPARRSMTTSYVAEHTYLGYSYEQGSVWPQPQQEERDQDTKYTIDPQNFEFKSAIHNNEILKNAFNRYKDLTFPDKSFEPRAKLEKVEKIVVIVDDEKQDLDVESDESYELTVEAPTVNLHAVSVWGALRGLETFSQLVFENETNYIVHKNKIKDEPRFKYRGFLIDTSRHYLSLQIIFQFLDAMAYSKFNVLHWHIVDDPSFPFVSKEFPQLHKEGAFQPKTHVYDPDDVKDIIQYARFRGIRVMPEFDTPGHTHSWNGIPNLLTDCKNTNQPEEIFNDMKGPINPTLNTTYAFLQKFFAEVAEVFPEKYIHLGGDEVDAACWLSNPQIQEWLKNASWDDFKNGTTLHTFYMKKLVKIIEGLDKNYIVWQEVFDDKVKLDKNTIVNVWKEGWKKEMERVTEAGHKAILSSCWYLNYVKYGLDWPKLYKCDPQDFDGTKEQKDLVIGGSAAMWGEYVDATNVIQYSFGRGFAVAERLWSSEDVTEVKSALKRIWEHQCRYLRRGIPAEPVTKSRFCRHEWNNTKK